MYVCANPIFCMCILHRYASPKRGLSVAGPIAQIGAGWTIISHVTGLAKDSILNLFRSHSFYEKSTNYWWRQTLWRALPIHTLRRNIQDIEVRYRIASIFFFVGIIIVPHYQNSHRPSVEPSTFRTLLRLPSDIAYLSSSHDVSPIHIDFPHPARLG